MRITRLLTVLAAGLVSAVAVPAGPAHAVAAAALPTFDHIVVVIEENHSYSEVIGNANAPYITSLADGGATMTRSFAVTHPSEPNYLALYSGSTQGITDDSCPHTFSTENLGHQLIAAGQTFKGYSESMPTDGYTGCSSGNYARKHNPWVNFLERTVVEQPALRRLPDRLHHAAEGVDRRTESVQRHARLQRQHR